VELVLSRLEQDSPATLAGADVADCYSREPPALIWFVMSLGASAELAADVAQSAFADAFPVWPAIQYLAPGYGPSPSAGMADAERVKRRSSPLRSGPARCPPPVPQSCGTRPALSWPRWPPSRPSSAR
jgi:hypothetical protein